MRRLVRIERLSRKDNRFSGMDPEKDLREAMLREMGDMGDEGDRQLAGDIMQIDDITNEGENDILSNHDSESLDVVPDGSRLGMNPPSHKDKVLVIDTNKEGGLPQVRSYKTSGE